MSSKRRMRQRQERRQRAEKAPPVAADGSPIGRQVLLEEISWGITEQSGVGPVLVLRMRGLDDQGRRDPITVGASEGAVDQLLMAVQQGAAKFKEQRARGGA